MNINRDLERGYYCQRVGEIKKELHQERGNIISAIRESLRVQAGIIETIKQEKLVLKKNNKLHKRKKAIRERQLKNTEDFFKEVLANLKAKTRKNANMFVTYMVGSHDGDGALNKVFAYNQINLDLLHSLCYRYNIVLTINVNDTYQTASMDFSVNPKEHLTNDQQNVIRVNNYNAINYFYHFYAKNKDGFVEAKKQKRK